MKKKYLFILIFFVLCCAAAIIFHCQKSPAQNGQGDAKNSSLSEYCDDAKAVFNETQIPVKIRYLRQRETAQEYEIKDAETINGILQAMKNIRVKGKTDTAVTDHDDVLVFVMSDSKEYSVTFNGGHLQAANENYELSDDADFWRLIEASVTETN